MPAQMLRACFPLDDHTPASPKRAPKTNRKSLLARRQLAVPTLDICAIRGSSCRASADTEVHCFGTRIHDWVSSSSTLSGCSVLCDANNETETPCPDSDAREPIVPFAEIYKLGAVLGSGSCATVHAATRVKDGMSHAVKCMNLHDEDARKFAVEEHGILKSLSHRAIISVEGLLHSRRDLWICLELCSETVEERARGNPFPGPAAAKLIAQLFDGVAYLHCRRVVHRDLKPSNLLLKDDGRILKIGDFGSAKQTGSGLGGGPMLSDRGTMVFAAPEMRSGLWNERVDVWAGGLCCFYMLTGELPRNAKKLKLGTADAKLSASAVAFVSLCLTVEMRDRPSAMALLCHSFIKEAVAEWSANEPQSADMWGGARTATRSASCPPPLSKVEVGTSPRTTLLLAACRHSCVVGLLETRRAERWRSSHQTHDVGAGCNRRSLSAHGDKTS
eukprot:NODE_4171_length_1926_cov_10.182879.p1 GENE.NODE_4171_length_1926_cov_10.182879~~NODE_4171_length_1926_cov_10.182879.p1  ORF type:complete len:446 (-),score=48.55 NODE_4171_length_1926_cov_10.182879:446-1783(-)